MVKNLKRQQVVKIFVSRGNQSFVYWIENWFSCVQWSMSQVNYSDHKAAAPPAWECVWSEDMTVSLWGHFSSLADGNCLTSWLVTFRRYQNHSLFLHLGWCSCRHQLTEDPANTYFSSESDHWQIAALDASVAKCHGEHRHGTGHN